MRPLSRPLQVTKRMSDSPYVSELLTVRDLVRFAVSRFTERGCRLAMAQHLHSMRRRF